MVMMKPWPREGNRREKEGRSLGWGKKKGCPKAKVWVQKTLGENSHAKPYRGVSN